MAGSPARIGSQGPCDVHHQHCLASPPQLCFWRCVQASVTDTLMAFHFMLMDWIRDNRPFVSEKARKQASQASAQWSSGKSINRSGAWSHLKALLDAIEDPMCILCGELPIPIELQELLCSMSTTTSLLAAQRGLGPRACSQACWSCPWKFPPRCLSKLTCDDAAFGIVVYASMTLLAHHSAFCSAHDLSGPWNARNHHYHHC